MQVLFGHHNVNCYLLLFVIFIVIMLITLSSGTQNCSANSRERVLDLKSDLVGGLEMLASSGCNFLFVTLHLSILKGVLWEGYGGVLGKNIACFTVTYSWKPSPYCSARRWQEIFICNNHNS